MLSRRRALHASPALRSGLQNIYDMDAPNDPLARPRLSVSKLTPEGLHLSDGLIVPGGVVFLDNRAFLWDVDPVKTEKATGRGVWNAWGIERFRIFEAVIPRPGESRLWWLDNACSGAQCRRQRPARQKSSSSARATRSFPHPSPSGNTSPVSASSSTCRTR